MKSLSREGFSLIELMIAIAIMGIMAGIATPYFKTFMAQRRLNGAARQIMSDLMLARQRAVSQNNEFKLFFDVNNYQYTILDDDDNDGTADSGEATEVRNIHTEYYDVTFSASGNPIFNPRGTANSLRTVTLTSSGTGTSKYVKVAITGRVKIDDTPP